MRLSAIMAAAVLAAAPAAGQPAQDAPLSLEHRALLRCSAAFAIVANRQAAGDSAALAYPALAHRGSEFFVRASARVMDEANLDREAIGRALSAEAEALIRQDELAKVMPACLAALETAGL